MMARRVWLGVAVPAMVFSLVACGDDDATGDSTTTVTVAAAGVSIPDTSDGEVTVSPGFSIDGVLAAAVLLAEGDVEQAVADGVVTVLEVDAAAQAIREGTLETWLIAAGG